jgi:hypothetical protein
MISLSELLEDVAAHIRACPQGRAVYQQPNGSVLVAWTGTATSGTTGELQAWEHTVEIYVRAAKRSSPLTLLQAVIDGVPEGQDLRWRYLCVNDYVLPPEISEVVRVIDEEGIDYFLIRTLFREKGDYEYGVSGQQ